MLYQETPKTLEEIQSELIKGNKLDDRIAIISVIICILSLPLNFIVMRHPELFPPLSPLGMYFLVCFAALTFIIPYLIIGIYLFFIPGHSEFPNQLFKPASEKNIHLCTSMVSHESMKPWKEYMDKVIASGRTIHNYELKAIEEDWNKIK